MPSSTLHPAITAAFEAEIDDARRCEALLAAVCAAYTSPERHYHNLCHLGHLVRELETVRDAVSDWNLLLLAAAYHDIVYDTARPDNEEASAIRAGTDLLQWIDAPRLQNLQDIILATKHHERSPDPDTNLFCDADLAILGAPADVYTRYAAQIRAEYGRYPDALYNPGRAAVLRKLLDEPSLFKTASFQERFETAARANLRRELELLQA